MGPTFGAGHVVWMLIGGQLSNAIKLKSVNRPKISKPLSRTQAVQLISAQEIPTRGGTMVHIFGTNFGIDDAMTKMWTSQDNGWGTPNADVRVEYFDQSALSPKIYEMKTCKLVDPVDELQTVECELAPGMGANLQFIVSVGSIAESQCGLVNNKIRQDGSMSTAASREENCVGQCTFWCGVCVGPEFFEKEFGDKERKDRKKHALTCDDYTAEREDEDVPYYGDYHALSRRSEYEEEYGLDENGTLVPSAEVPQFIDYGCWHSGSQENTGTYFYNSLEVQRENADFCGNPSLDVLLQKCAIRARRNNWWGFGVSNCTGDSNYDPTDQDNNCATKCECVEARENTYYKHTRGASDQCTIGDPKSTRVGTYGRLKSDTTSDPAVSVYKLHKRRVLRNNVTASSQTMLRYSPPTIIDISGADDSPTSGSLVPFIVDGNHFGSLDAGVVVRVEYSNQFYKADGVTDQNEMIIYANGKKYPSRYSLKLGQNCKLKTEHSQFECTTAEGSGKDFFWRIKTGLTGSELWPKDDLSKRTSYKQPVVTTLFRYNISLQESSFTYSPIKQVKLQDLCTEIKPCSTCQGDCEKDADCKGSLKCFQRNLHSDLVPGCGTTGYDDDDSGIISSVPKGPYNYCYNDFGQPDLMNLGVPQSAKIIQDVNDPVQHFNTQGGEIMTIIGTDLGPSTIPAELFQASYGPIIGTKNEFQATNCRVVKPHIQAECELVPGAGDAHNWRLFVDGSESTTPKSGFAPPQITSITGPGASDASCLGKEEVMIYGVNFGEFVWDLQSVTYGVTGRDYVACQMKSAPPDFYQNWTLKAGSGLYYQNWTHVDASLEAGGDSQPSKGYRCQKTPTPGVPLEFRKKCRSSFDKFEVLMQKETQLYSKITEEWKLYSNRAECPSPKDIVDTVTYDLSYLDPWRNAKKFTCVLTTRLVYQDIDRPIASGQDVWVHSKTLTKPLTKSTPPLIVQQFLQLKHYLSNDAHEITLQDFTIDPKTNLIVDIDSINVGTFGKNDVGKSCGKRFQICTEDYEIYDAASDTLDDGTTYGCEDVDFSKFKLSDARPKLTLKRAVSHPAEGEFSCMKTSCEDQGCTLDSHNRITCTTVPGIGEDLWWKVTVRGQSNKESTYGKTSYAPPSIISVSPTKYPTKRHSDSDQETKINLVAKNIGFRDPLASRRYILTSSSEHSYYFEISDTKIYCHAEQTKAYDLCVAQLPNPNPNDENCDNIPLKCPDWEGVSKESSNGVLESSGMKVFGTTVNDVTSEVTVQLRVPELSCHHPSTLESKINWKLYEPEMKRCNATDLQIAVIVENKKIKDSDRKSLPKPASYYEPRIKYVHVGTGPTANSKKLELVGSNFGKFGDVWAEEVVHNVQTNTFDKVHYKIELGDPTVIVEHLNGNEPKDLGEIQTTSNSYIKSYTHDKIELVFFAHETPPVGRVWIDRGGQESNKLTFKEPSPNITYHAMVEHKLDEPWEYFPFMSLDDIPSPIDAAWSSAPLSGVPFDQLEDKGYIGYFNDNNPEKNVKYDFDVVVPSDIAKDSERKSSFIFPTDGGDWYLVMKCFNCESTKYDDEKLYSQTLDNLMVCIGELLAEDGLPDGKSERKCGELNNDLTQNLRLEKEFHNGQFQARCEIGCPVDNNGACKSGDSDSIPLEGKPKHNPHLFITNPPKECTAADIGPSASSPEDCNAEETCVWNEADLKCEKDASYKKEVLIKCKVPPGEGSQVAGFVQRTTQKSKQFFIQYMRPNITKISLWDHNINKTIECDNPDPTTRCESKTKWSNLLGKIPTVGGYVLIEGTNFGMYGPKAYLTNYPFNCKDVNLDPAVQTQGNPSIPYNNDMPPFFNEFVRTCQLEVVRWEDSDASIFGIQQGSPKNVNENWLHTKFLVKIPMGASGAEMRLSMKVDDQFDVNDQQEHSCVGDVCKISYALPHLDVSDNDAANGLFSMIKTEKHENIHVDALAKEKCNNFYDPDRQETISRPKSQCTSNTDPPCIWDKGACHVQNRNTEGSYKMIITGQNFGNPHNFGTEFLKAKVTINDWECKIDPEEMWTETEIRCDVPEGHGKGRTLTIQVMNQTVHFDNAFSYARPMVDMLDICEYDSSSKGYNCYAAACGDDSPESAIFKHTKNLPTSGKCAIKCNDAYCPTNKNEKRQAKLKQIVTTGKKTLFIKVRGENFGTPPIYVESWPIGNTGETYYVKRGTNPGTKNYIYDENAIQLGEWGVYGDSLDLQPIVLETDLKPLGGAIRHVQMGFSKKITTFEVSTHKELIFKLEPGQGRDVPLKISISSVVNEQAWHLSFAKPEILGIIFPQGDTIFPQPDNHLMGNVNYINNGDYTAPTSGCAEFFVSKTTPEINGKDIFNNDGIFMEKICKTQAQIVIFGKNLGLNSTINFVDGTATATDGEVVERSHYHVVVKLPVGIGSSTLKLQTGDTFIRGTVKIGTNTVDVGIKYDDEDKSSLSFSLLVPTNRQYQCVDDPDPKILVEEDCLYTPKHSVWFKDPTKETCECAAMTAIGFTPTVKAPATLERASNGQMFNYSKPDIVKIRYGPDLNTLSGDKFGAIGGKATGVKEATDGADPYSWRIFIFGENFGETATPINITLSDECTMDANDKDRSLCPTSSLCPGHPKCMARINSETCIDARWHKHQKHDYAQKGRPFLSCEPLPTPVGYKTVK